jgi:hypothetical protein
VTAPAPPDRHPSGPLFWTGVAVGLALMAWGVRLFWQSTTDSGARLGFAAHLVGIDLLHDLVVAPVLCLAGVVVARLARGPWRAPVQAGLIVSASLLVVAALPLWGTADGARNPTIQPLDYRTATLTTLAATWVAVAGWGSWRSRRRGAR